MSAALETALKNLKSTKAAAEDVVAGDFRTRPGREAARRQAQAGLPEAEKTFAAALRTSAFPIFLSGVGVPDFIALAGADDEVVAVDFRKATANVRDGVRAMLGKNREFSPHVFATLVRECRQVGASLGLTSIPSPQYDGAQYLETEEDMQALVDTYLLKYMGPEFLALVIEREAVRAVLATDNACAAPIIPVLITGVPVETQIAVTPRLFGGKSSSFNVGPTVTVEDVNTAFAGVRAALRAKSEEKSQ